MSIFMIDVESDGSIPGPQDYSMVCFGAVLVDRNFTFKKTFYGETAPISKNWDPEALAISGFTREQHETFEDPFITMKAFKEWVLTNNEARRPIFMADNNGMTICSHIGILNTSWGINKTLSDGVRET